MMNYKYINIMKTNSNIFNRSLSGIVVCLVLLIIISAGCNGTEKKEENKEEVTAYQHWELTDSLIIEGVETEMMFHSNIPADNISVESAQGIVTLSGDVKNLLIRDEAEEIAGAIKGVRAIINQINVDVPDIPDGQLKDEVVQMLRQNTVTDKYEILVEVDDGEVQLSGTVDSWQEEMQAVNVTKSVRGVRAVDDKINFAYPETPRPDDEVARDIASALRNDVRVDDALIDVTVDNGEVTLSGTVGSVAEKSRTISNAWAAGVNDVNADNLEVETWARDPQMRQEKYVDKTDEEIELAVQAALINDYRVNSFMIDVEVNSGVVTLKGNVDNLKAKKVAAEDAKNVVGVWRVNNDLEVRPVEFVNNKALADQVRKTIQLHPYLDRYDIRVNVDEGDVELYGVVGSSFDKKQAEDVASGMPGVVTVENYLEIEANEEVAGAVQAPVTDEQEELTATETTKTDAEIKEQIEKQLYWSPFVNENEIKVTVENGNATLTGQVDTEMEREAAERNAMQGGAVTVNNRLVVAYSQNTSQNGF